MGNAQERSSRRRLPRVSAHRLKSGDRPVTRIAFEAGYESHEAFTRAFTARFGQAPSRFRESLRHKDTPTGADSDEVGAGISPTWRAPGFPGPPLAVRVETIGPLHVAFVRHVGPYERVQDAWQILMEWAARHRVIGPSSRVLGIAHDDPEITQDDRIRYDACLMVGGEVQPEGPIGVVDVPAGRFAVALHRGPYEELSASYARLCGEWLAASRYEAGSGPVLEWYLNSPQETAPRDLMTEICLPIERCEKNRA